MLKTAVLCSGGLDSTVLMSEQCARGYQVTPLHIRCGFAWEAAEARTLAALLETPHFRNRVEPVVTLRLDISDVYPATHWALTGSPPGRETADRDVYLEGRNLLLIAKAAVWCRTHHVPRLAIGSLRGNPFPDATPEFFDAIGKVITEGYGDPFEVVAPFLTWTKREVVARGRALQTPLEQSLSCMAPAQDDGHCHACSKCRERTDALQ